MISINEQKTPAKTQNEPPSRMQKTEPASRGISIWDEATASSRRSPHAGARPPSPAGVGENRNKSNQIKANRRCELDFRAEREGEELRGGPRRTGVTAGCMPRARAAYGVPAPPAPPRRASSSTSSLTARRREQQRHRGSATAAALPLAHLSSMVRAHKKSGHGERARPGQRVEEEQEGPLPPGAERPPLCCAGLCCCCWWRATMGKGEITRRWDGCSLLETA
nr:unnamed protein product [Digitaria exilis]